MEIVEIGDGDGTFEIPAEAFGVLMHAVMRAYLVAIALENGEPTAQHALALDAAAETRARKADRIFGMLGGDEAETTARNMGWADAASLRAFVFRGLPAGVAQ